MVLFYHLGRLLLSNYKQRSGYTRCAVCTPNVLKRDHTSDTIASAKLHNTYPLGIATQLRNILECHLDDLTFLTHYHELAVGLLLFSENGSTNHRSGLSGYFSSFNA